MQGERQDKPEMVVGDNGDRMTGKNLNKIVSKGMSVDVTRGRGEGLPGGIKSL